MNPLILFAAAAVGFLAFPLSVSIYIKLCHLFNQVIGGNDDNDEPRS